MTTGITRNRTLQTAFLLLAASSCSSALAEAPVALTFDDPQVEWGPCPEFMPEGCQIAVLHGDPAQDNADIFFKVPANAVIPSHWHTSPERMVLVAGELHVTYDGHDTVVLKPGTYAYGPAELPHKANCADKGDCVLFIAFESPVDAVPTKASGN